MSPLRINDAHCEFEEGKEQIYPSTMSGSESSWLSSTLNNVRNHSETLLEKRNICSKSLYIKGDAFIQMLDDSLDDLREHSCTESVCPFMCVCVRPK